MLISDWRAVLETVGQSKSQGALSLGSSEIKLLKGLPNLVKEITKLATLVAAQQASPNGIILWGVNITVGKNI